MRDVRLTSRAVFLALLLAFGGMAARGRSQAAPALRELKVCSDPNNLPFSNERQEGFENRIAELVARELNAKVRYTWWAQRRGFVRNTLNTGECDVVMGVVSGFERVKTTIPYYRSSYVFVTRSDRHLRIRSFDDPVLRRLTIGVQMVGDNFTNTPPAHALSKRHMIENVRGYSVYGDYRQPNPPARVIDAVAAGDVDVAIAWGPLAGYFARREPVPLIVSPVAPQIDRPPFLPFVFDISMGVRLTDKTLRHELNAIITRRRKEIDAILDQYGVPRVNSTKPIPAI
jgi:quinoprotein dehydrogenase-associated probable ABC transporter substrate-binding protein